VPDFFPSPRPQQDGLQQAGVCLCVCVHLCIRACVRACVRECVRARECDEGEDPR